jgi:hypothetical protein
MVGYKTVEQKITTGKTVEVEIMLEPARDVPAPKRIDGKFSGIVNLQFENCHFIPDQKTVERYPGEIFIRILRTLGTQHCWVTLGPDVEHLFEYGREYRITCRGILIGPGSYGHFGQSAYELLVEDVLEVDLL